MLRARKVRYGLSMQKYSRLKSLRGKEVKNPEKQVHYARNKIPHSN